MKTIIHAVDIAAPRSQVYAALTTAEGLASWWSTKVTVTPGVDGIAAFEFVESFNPRMQVTQLVTDQAVYWKCVGGHDNFLDNTFSFELTDHANKSQLLFRQDYARELPDEVYGMYNFNWAYYLESLRLFCETGKGKPFQA